jgi:hypothetical protein
LGGAGAGATATSFGGLAFLPKAEPRLSWKSREPHFEHFDGFASSEATPHLLQTLMAMWALPLRKLTIYYDKNYSYVDLMGDFGVNLQRRGICLFLGSVNISLT